MAIDRCITDTLHSSFQKMAVYSISTGIFSPDDVKLMDDHPIHYYRDVRQYLPAIQRVSSSRVSEMHPSTRIVSPCDRLRIPGRPLERLKELIFFGRVFPVRRKLHHIVLYSHREEEGVTHRFLEMNQQCNSTYGKDTFNLSRITDSSLLGETINELGIVEEPLTALVRLPYFGPDSSFFLMGNSPVFEEADFIISMGGEMSIIKFDILASSFVIDGERIESALRAVAGMLPPLELMLGSCMAGECKMCILLDPLLRSEFTSAMQSVQREIGKDAMTFGFTV